jgi:hypothetical protein
MKLKYLAPIMLMAIAAAFLATPVLAKPNGPRPKYDKYVASLMLGEDRYGQVIFNTNLEDGKFELEVEVEECMELADSTVDVYLGDELIGTIYIDMYGNGKATFYVTTDPTGMTITVVYEDITLTSGDWRLWVKGKGPK